MRDMRIYDDHFWKSLGLFDGNKTGVLSGKLKVRYWEKRKVPSSVDISLEFAEQTAF